jgi:ethanolamine utilization microcompartment shell protein EutS
MVLLVAGALFAFAIGSTHPDSRPFGSTGVGTLLILLVPSLLIFVAGDVALKSRSLRLGYAALLLTALATTVLLDAQWVS